MVTLYEIYRKKLVTEYFLHVSVGPCDGKVIFAGRNGGYGKVIKIRHKDGYISLYAHQSKLKMKVGTKVKRGDVIGYVGNTGRSTGPHLHLGLYKNGQAINPIKVIKMTKKTLIYRDKKKFLILKNKYIKEINKIIKNKIKSKFWK